MTILERFEEGDALREIFLTEATEALEGLSSALLTLERDERASGAALGELLRRAHGLKGASAAAGLQTLADLVHDWESCMVLFREEKVERSPAAFEAMHAALAAVGALVTFAGDGGSPPEATLREAQSQLEAVFGAHVDIRHFDGESEAAAAVEGGIQSGAALRVKVEKLDRLMATAGELVTLGVGFAEHVRSAQSLLDSIHSVAWSLDRLHATNDTRSQLRSSSASISAEVTEQRERLRAMAAEAAELSARLLGHQTSFGVLTRRVRDDVRAARMVPLSLAMGQLPAAVQEVARRQGKKISLEVHGGDTEADRDILESIAHVVLHLVRNAADHGIEAEAERLELGKPATGTIRIEASGVGQEVLLTVEDDGAGISMDGVRAAAVRAGLFSADAAERLSENELKELVFQAGFSTASSLSDISGRGVGLDAVAQAVERIGGRIELETWTGLGSRFQLFLPTSRLSTRLLLVRAGSEELFALPVAAVERALHVGEGEVVAQERGHAIAVDGEAIPVARLGSLLGSPGADAGDDSFGVLLRTEDGRAVVFVDELLGHEEMITKGLGDHLANLPLISATTILASGRVVPIVRPEALVRRVREGDGVFATQPEVRRHDEGRTRVLVVDDSITTRTLQRNILEVAGYEVLTASDGAEALETLRVEPVSLVLSDIEMPRMDGLTLTRELRRQSDTERLPIILVSSLGSDEDKRAGLEVGADAYIVKTEFEQEHLLATVRRLL